MRANPLRLVARCRAFGAVLALGLVACSGASQPATPSCPRSQASSFDAMVVGTAHKGHLLVADYPMTKLGDLVRAYEPDLVLVEIRPEPFAKGHFEDGPIEMSYVTFTARKLGIAVEPIDWWREEDVGAPSPANDPEGARLFERDFAELEKKSDSFGSFAELNSADHSRDFLRVENARARFGMGDDVLWHRRQSWFNERARAAVEQHHAHRVAAFVGFEHRPELEAFLAAFGSSVTNPTTVSSGSSSTPIPDEVITFWKEGIARLRAGLASAPAQAVPAIQSKIRYWEVAADRRGVCCVKEADLRPAP